MAFGDDGWCAIIHVSQFYFSCEIYHSRAACFANVRHVGNLQLDEVEKVLLRLFPDSTCPFHNIEGFKEFHYWTYKYQNRYAEPEFFQKSE